MENEEFKIDFVNRFAYHINNTFKSSTMLDSINAFQTLFIPEIREHIERWNYPSSISQWQIYIGEMREFARKRSCFMKDHIMDYMELTEFNYECPPDTLAYYSKLDIYPNPGKGKFSVHNSSPDVIIGDIYITSISGQVVYYKKDVILLLNEVETLDVEHLPNGTYVLNLVNKGSLERKKLIIIK